MKPPNPAPSPAHLGGPFLRLAALVFAMLLAGCASDAPYDYGLSLEVIRMDEDTRALLATRSTRPLPAAEAKRYLRDARGTLQRLHDRGLGHRNDTPQAHLIEFLRRRFEFLAARRTPVTRQEIGRLAPAIADLREMESRRGNDWRGTPGAVSYGGGDDTFVSTDDLTYQKRRGDRHEHRGRRDSDRRDHGRHDHSGRKDDGDEKSRDKDKKR